MKLIYLIPVFLILVMGLASADSDIFKVNQPANLTISCDDGTGFRCNGQVTCSFDYINYPDGSVLLAGAQMTYQNTYYNYTINDTLLNKLGTYTYCLACSDGSYSGHACGFFKVNGSGQEVTQSQVIMIILGFFIILVMAAFFFVLAMMFKHPGTKIFLMALSSITMIILIGLTASNASTYLAEFPNLVSIYNNYYIVMIVLAGGAMLGIMLWLIYYAFTLFNKSRGRIPDDN